MNILFLSAWCPLPADNGIRLRISQLLRGLSQRHTVDLISFAPEPPDAASLRELRRICRDVEFLTETPFPNRAIGRLSGLLSSQPRSVVANYSPTMAETVRRRAQQRTYDLVIASELHMAPYALLVRNTPRLLEALEVGLLHDAPRGASLAQRGRHSLMWWKSRNYITRILRQFHAATVVSDREWALVRGLLPDEMPLVVVPNGVDIPPRPAMYGAANPDTLIYPGAISFPPNAEAVSFFARDILPRIHCARPQVQLSVTGKASAEAIASLPATNGLVFTGYLDDVRPSVAQAWAEVVPLLSGSGTRLKVLEAMALGTPVISSSKGVEGLNAVPERDFLLADTAEEFARQTLRLLDDPKLRATLAANGRRFAVGYDWAHSVVHLHNVIATITPRERPALARSAFTR